MSNELQLSTDINVITAEINSYKQVAGQAIFEIGKRLKHVKENDLVHGEWEKWCKDELNFSSRQARKYIRVYERFSNRNLGSEMGLKKLDMLSDFDDEELNTPTQTSSGEIKKLTEMTQKEIEEYKERERRANEDKKKAEHNEQIALKELKELKNKQQQFKEVVIEKEKIIDNTDYETINKLKQEIKNKEGKINSIERQRELLNERLQQEEQDAEQYRKLKEELEHLHSKKDNLHRQIESATALSGLYVEIEHFLQNKLAPVKYSRAISEAKNDEVVLENLREIIDRVLDWCGEMETLIPKKNTNIIDAEVIEYE